MDIVVKFTNRKSLKKNDKNNKIFPLILNCATKANTYKHLWIIYF